MKNLKLTSILCGLVFIGQNALAGGFDIGGIGRNYSELLKSIEDNGKTVTKQLEANYCGGFRTNATAVDGTQAYELTFSDGDKLSIVPLELKKTGTVTGDSDNFILKYVTIRNGKAVVETRSLNIFAQFLVDNSVDIQWDNGQGSLFKVADIQARGGLKFNKNDGCSLDKALTKVEGKNQTLRHPRRGGDTQESQALSERDASEELE